MKPEVQRLKRTLLALPDLELRMMWLGEQLRALPSPGAARMLDQLVEDAESGGAQAREVMVAIALLLAGLGTEPWISELRETAAAEHLLSLGRLLRRPSSSSEPPPKDEIAAVPSYTNGRELTLGERRSLARRPNRAQFDKLLADPHPMVIRQLLANPQMTERDVVKLVTRRPARPDLIRLVARSARWLCRERVRLAILLNPGSPAEVAVPLVGLCTRSQLSELVQSTDIAPVLRLTALELLERRPPLASPSDQPVQ